MTIKEIIEIGSIMILGGVIQSSSGFGYGLFALPLLLFFGFPLPVSVMIIITGSGIQKIAAVKVLADNFDWKELFPYMGTGLLALPIGIYLMFSAANLDQSLIKQIIGGCIILLLILRWQGFIRTRDHIAPIWGHIASFWSGLLNGFANIGGPPLVIWTLSHRWSNEKIRVVLLAFSLIFVPFQLVLMPIVFGSPVIGAFIKSLILSPFVLLGTWLGLIIGARITQRQLKLYMQALLIIIALTSILKPIF